AARGPGIDFLANLVRRFSRAVPSWSRRAEVRARAHDARADLFAAFDALPCAEHPFRIDFAGGEGGRDAVAEEDERVRRVLVDALRIEEIDRVVCVQIEESRQDGLVVVEPDDLCG